MKILSYNIYGIKDTEDPIPKWDERQKNIQRILTNLLKDSDIKVCCFQEVNQYNFDMLNKTLIDNNFKVLDKFPMITQNVHQYNIIAIRNDCNNINYIYCLPHGTDTEYRKIDEQVIDYGMSDYRTTVFVNFSYDNKSYLIGNIHTDYISTEGKIKGTVKSLDYMDGIEADYKLIVGDMNMISHMSEVYNILEENNNYAVISKPRNVDNYDCSWHGYNTGEPVNVDFAFVENNKKDLYDYKIIKQDNLQIEGSDHRPIIIETIKLN